ncbi:glycosyltransferase [Arthrobacter bussei]|uniref:Glycosyltransferase n=1 Tax=Arthrobacter bussei TaxID=2594179 RepID=A0A7X1NMI8_9MICC|nr:glycosyltransferase [Arthrobacter bussei]MPY09516.1 glycosyltransferase [Arthrobacter bussei]
MRTQGVASIGGKICRPVALGIMHSTSRAQGLPAVQKSNCAAVISAYHPPRGLVDRVSALVAQFQVVVIADDGGGDEHGVLQRCRDEGAMTVELGSNQGIAAALNRAVEEIKAGHAGIDYIVTFDQDSTPPADLIAVFGEAWAEAVSAGLLVGSVSPGRINGALIGRAEPGAAYFPVSEPIQSGTLVPLSVMQEIGGLDESLFIDGVDTDMYWRLRARGYVAIAASRADLSHELGARSQAALLGRPLRRRGEPIMIMQSAPFRYYYLVRNRLELVRRYGRSRPLPMVRGLALDLRHLAVVLVFGTGRRRRLQYAARGLSDGLRGRRGRMTTMGNGGKVAGDA